MSRMLRHGPHVLIVLAAAVVACGDHAANRPDAPSGGGGGMASGSGAVSSATTGGSGGNGGEGGAPPLAPWCSDGELSPGETGVDCGGVDCPACSIGLGCNVESDCETGSCVDHFTDLGRSCFPKHVFSAVYGDASNQEARAAALKSDGSVVVAGLFEGSIDFGGGNLTSVGDTDAFIVGLDPSGGFQHHRALGGPSYQAPTTLVADGGGAIVGGFSGGPIDLGGGPVTPVGSNDVFVSRLGAQGTTEWATLLGGAELEVLEGVAAAPNGGVTIAGRFTGTTDLGTGPIQSAGDSDAYLASIDAQGATAWVEHYGGSGSDAVYGPAVDSQGHIIVAGKSWAEIDFGTGPLEAPGYAAHFFVVKLDGDTRDVIWTRSFPLVKAGGTMIVKVDASDDVIIAGGFVDEIDFGTGLVTGDGFTGYLAKLDGATGAAVWTQHYGGAPYSDRVRDLAVRGTDIFVVAQGDATAAFARPNLEGSLLLRFDAEGNFVYGVPIHGVPWALDVRGAHGVVAGELLGVAHYGGALLFSNDGSDYDVFVAKIELP